MTFVKKFNKGDEVMTTQRYAECMHGKIRSGVVVDEYESEQSLPNIVEFIDSNGIKDVINAYWLTRYIDPVITEAKDENGNTIYSKEERIKRFKDSRAKKNASKQLIKK